MYNSGDAAEQVVRISLEGTEVALKLTGSAAKNIAAMPSVTELLHAGKTPEDMMQLALAGFTPNVLDERTVQYQCDCSAERTKEMLLSLGRAELVRMRDEDLNCEVVCHFCHSKYQYDLNALLAEYDAQAAQAAEAEHPIQ